MIKRNLHIFMTSVVFIILTACQSNESSKEVNWNPTFRVESTDPFGLFIFSEEIEKIKPTFSKIRRIFKGVSAIADGEYDELYDPDERHSTYLYIDAYDKMNTESRNTLMDFAYNGAHVFISSWDIHYGDFQFNGFTARSESFLWMNSKDTLSLSIDEKKPLAFSDNIKRRTYFEITDSTWAQPLGYYQSQSVISSKRCNFVAMRHGYGIVYFHTMPEVFSNFFLLTGNNSEYLEQVISQFKFGQFKWFVNYVQEYEGEYSLLKYMFEQPGLTMAWYLLWILLAIAVFTYAKRMQRIIPIVNPKKNFSVEYAKGLAQFHLLKKNYHGLIDKQIVVLLDKLRNEYRLDTSVLDHDFAQRMHAVTNCNRIAAEDFVKYVQKQRVRTVAFDFDFEELRLILKRLNL